MFSRISDPASLRKVSALGSRSLAATAAERRRDSGERLSAVLGVAGKLCQLQLAGVSTVRSTTRGPSPHAMAARAFGSAVAAPPPEPAPALPLLPLAAAGATA